MSGEEDAYISLGGENVGQRYSEQARTETVNEGQNVQSNTPASYVNFGDGGTEAMAQFGWEYGRQYVGKHIDSVAVNKNFSMLKHPFWGREMRQHSQLDQGDSIEPPVAYLPPRDDINAPDLYVPSMAFVSWVITIGMALGLLGHFDPEKLGLTASRGLAFLVAEVLFLKAGLYLLNSLTVPFLDCVSLCSYKYVGITLTVIAGLLSSPFSSTPSSYPTLSLIFLVYTAISMFVFVKNTLRLFFPFEDEDTIPGGAMAVSGVVGGGGGRRKGSSSFNRKYFLLVASALQFVIMYFLGGMPTG